MPNPPNPAATTMVVVMLVRVAVRLGHPHCLVRHATEIATDFLQMPCKIGLFTSAGLSQATCIWGDGLDLVDMTQAPGAKSRGQPA